MRRRQQCGRMIKQKLSRTADSVADGDNGVRQRLRFFFQRSIADAARERIIDLLQLVAGVIVGAGRCHQVEKLIPLVGYFRHQTADQSELLVRRTLGALAELINQQTNRFATEFALFCHVLDFVGRLAERTTEQLRRWHALFLQRDQRLGAE